jgi:hypothetical protein
LLREIREGSYREIYHVHELGDSIILRCQFCPNPSIDLAQPQENSFFGGGQAEIDKMILKFRWKSKGLRRTKNFFEKVERLKIPDTEF